MQVSVDCTEQDLVCSVIAKLSYVPWVNDFNKGKYLKFVICFQSCAVLAVFWELFCLFFLPPSNEEHRWCSLNWGFLNLVVKAHKGMPEVCATFLRRQSKRSTSRNVTTVEAKYPIQVSDAADCNCVFILEIPFCVGWALPSARVLREISCHWGWNG